MIKLREKIVFLTFDMWVRVENERLNKYLFITPTQCNHFFAKFIPFLDGWFFSQLLLKQTRSIIYATI